MLMLASPAPTALLASAYAEFREMVARGEANGAPETPIGASHADAKLYRDFKLSARGTPPAIRKLHEVLAQLPDRLASDLTAAFGLRDFPHLSALMDNRTGPVLRMTWYSDDGTGEINQPHTDIDLFTILPAATRPGLEVFSEGKWVSVKVANDQIAILPGEMLEQLGAAQATKHRVVAGHDGERISASLFVNASPSMIIRGDTRASDIMNERLDEIRRSDGRHDRRGL